MNTPDFSAPSAAAPRAAIDDCWNRIGVQGDRSCPELKPHVHCRNCPVYSRAVATLLDREMPADSVAAWTEHFARPVERREAGLNAVVVFRLGPEWLVLPTTVFVEIAAVRPIHSLPHRRDASVLGLVNIRGELLICVSPARILGLEAAPAAATETTRAAQRRLLVLHREGSRLVFPVDEVGGTHRYHPRELREAPATVARAAATYTRHILPWQGKSVGCLDDQLLFYTLNRSLA